MENPLEPDHIKLVLTAIAQLEGWDRSLPYDSIRLTKELEWTIRDGMVYPSKRLIEKIRLILVQKGIDKLKKA